MKKMHLFLFALAAAFLLGMPAMVFAVDVPGITIADFESPEASAIWSILAGQGTWGVLLFAILGVVWKFSRPYLDEWMRERKLATLWDAVTTGVSGAMQAYVEAAKAAGDGKLTEEQAAHARDLARSYIIAFMKTQGIDVIREYGQDVVDYLIEAVLRGLKIDNAVFRAVMPPLPDLAP